MLAACFLAFALYYNATAASRGTSIGQETGALVGKAIGSLEGITKGREEGTEAGKAAGLSARDTEADIANEIRKIENLEVLVASVKINDVHSIGENVDYAALYLLKGDVVFSVDLSQAEIEEQGNRIQITLQLELMAFLGESVPMETELKFLIERPIPRLLEALSNCERVDIIQTDLKTDNNTEELRIRQHGANGHYIYFKTKSIRNKST